MDLLAAILAWTLAVWLFALWQSEKKSRQSIQRAHNTQVRISLNRGAALKTIISSVERQERHGEVPQLARSIKSAAQEALDNV